MPWPQSLKTTSAHHEIILPPKLDSLQLKWYMPQEASPQRIYNLTSFPPFSFSLLSFLVTLPTRSVLCAYVAKLWIPWELCFSFAWSSGAVEWNLLGYKAFLLVYLDSTKSGGKLPLAKSPLNYIITLFQGRREFLKYLTY